MGLAQINIRFSANLKELSTQMQNARREFEKAGSKMQDLGGKMSMAISLPIMAIGTAAYKMAADLQDAFGATDQIYKNASASTKAWAESLPSYYGVATKEALEYSNMMGTMLVNIGKLTEEQASQQAAKLVELAGDLTAMYGGTTASAVQALTGALKGNNSMLDNYGMAVNEATIKARAYQMGLAKQGEELSLNAKQQATLALIYEQTGAAQGQAAREADSASGVMRAFRTEISNLTTEFGQHLLPIITPVLEKFRALVERFRSLDPEVKKAIVVFGGIVAAIGPVIAAIGTAVALIPTFTAGLAAIGTAFTAMTGPIGLAVAAIAGLTYLIINNWDDVKQYIIDVANYFIELYNSSLVVRSGVQYIILSFKNLWSAAKFVINAIGTLFKGLWEGLKNSAQAIGSIIKAILTGDISSIPAIFKNAFTESTRDFQNMLSGWKEDWNGWTSDVKANTKTAIEDALNSRYQLIKPDATKVKDEVKESVETAVVEGVDEGIEKASGKTIKIKVEPEFGSVAYYDKIISELEQAQRNTSVDNAMYKVFEEKIQEYKDLRDAITGELRQVVLEPEQGTVAWYEYHIDQLKEAQKQAGITVEEFARMEQEINLLEATFRLQVEGTEETKEKIIELSDAAKLATQVIDNAFSALTGMLVDSLGEAENGFERFKNTLIQNVVKIIAATLSQALAQAIGAAVGAGSSTGPAAPFTIPAFIASLSGAVLGAFAAIPKFANGGIVSGPTLGLMGEYAGAANNPEVIAPLSKLREMIEPASGAVAVNLSGNFRLDGNDLVLAIDRTNSRNNRMF